MRSRLIISGVILWLTTGCDPGPQSGRGFTLPEGDIAVGKDTFVRMNCHACHTVGDIEQLLPLNGEPEVTVALGGEVSRIHTYGELVTSIINPSHRFAQGYSPEDVQTPDGQSKMTIYNDVMTVRELTDIVAFLQSQYKLREIRPTPYMPYH
jgi:mono/diheme cytochrome c family protein